MPKHLTAALFCAMALAACQPAAAPDSAEEASSAGGMMQPGAGDAAAFAVVQAWAPTLSWSAPVPGTNQDTIHIDDERTIGAGMIQTQEITATLAPAQYTGLFIDNRAALDSAAMKNGWQKHAALDADGSVGTQWGYMRKDDEGESFLVVSALGEDCGDGLPACASYTATAELTSPLAEGDDL